MNTRRRGTPRFFQYLSLKYSHGVRGECCYRLRQRSRVSTQFWRFIVTSPGRKTDGAPRVYYIMCPIIRQEISRGSVYLPTSYTLDCSQRGPIHFRIQCYVLSIIDKYSFIYFIGCVHVAVFFFSTYANEKFLGEEKTGFWRRAIFIFFFFFFRSRSRIAGTMNAANDGVGFTNTLYVGTHT